MIAPASVPPPGWPHQLPWPGPSVGRVCKVNIHEDPKCPDMAGERSVLSWVRRASKSVAWVILSPGDVDRLHEELKSLGSIGLGSRAGIAFAIGSAVEWTGADGRVWLGRVVDYPQTDYRLVEMADGSRTHVHVDVLRAHAPAPTGTAPCTDCKGTGVYLGTGFYPAEPCRRCGGSKLEPGPKQAIPTECQIFYSDAGPSIGFMIPLPPIGGLCNDMAIDTLRASVGSSIPAHALSNYGHKLDDGAFAWFHRVGTDRWERTS